MAKADQRDLLPRIAVATLLIWGERDARSPLTVARQFAELIPDARLVVIPSAGHMSNLDRPAPFKDAVRDSAACTRRARRLCTTTDDAHPSLAPARSR
jgi:pimeloyl-ACP methyl ester carboxylesterase